MLRYVLYLVFDITKFTCIKLVLLLRLYHIALVQYEQIFWYFTYVHPHNLFVYKKYNT